ncbi:MAG TPA: hypothetical protein VJ862_02700 [Rhodanobacteraceae bacterium]|nr:hypothetical protein [Rhodanobacteraceae bacterium]
MTGFFARLKQRKLVQWALAYIAFAFALIQVLDVVAQRFGWPDPLEKLLILALAIGFVVVLVLAWYHGERGVQKVSGTEIVILALLLAIGGGLLWRYERVLPPVGSPDSVAGATSSGLRIVSATAAAQAIPIPAKSVAVLPLSNESGDKDQQYFSDGLSEDLITALSQFAGLRVINRDSSFQFRGSKDSVQAIGAKLGVAHLLEGSVQKLGDEVRISAELVNCADGSTLWSQHYDRPYKDLFALQDDITKSVAGALKAKLLDSGGAVPQSDRPPGGSLAAYNALLQGKFYAQRFTEADLRKAIAYFTDATRLDPDYALAWAGLGETQGALAGNFLGGAEASRSWTAAHASVQHALQLDPNLAFAHSAYVFILWSADHDWTRAAAEARRGYQLLPQKGYFALAQMQAALGHAQQAVAVMRRGLQTDPLCAGCYGYLAGYLPALGRLDDAAQAARESLQLDPEYYFGLFQLAYVEVMRGDAATALQVAQQAPPGSWRNDAMAVALQIGGNRAAADAALQTMIAKQADYAAYQIAEIYAVRRDPDNMFKWLERASRNRDPGIAFLLTDAPILRYQNDPRFAAFCRNVGLPTTTDAKALP